MVSFRDTGPSAGSSAAALPILSAPIERTSGGELGRIQFKHYDGRRLTIYGKGEKVRYLPIIGPEATSRLERHILERQPGTEEFLLYPEKLGREFYRGQSG